MSETQYFPTPGVFSAPVILTLDHSPFDLMVALDGISAMSATFASYLPSLSLPSVAGTTGHSVTRDVR